MTTRLWWLYHSMASFDVLQSSSANNGNILNHFVKIWWWPLFQWFESNVRSGPLPNGFNLPLPAICLKVSIFIFYQVARCRIKHSSIYHIILICIKFLFLIDLHSNSKIKKTPQKCFSCCTYSWFSNQCSKLSGQ